MSWGGSMREKDNPRTFRLSGGRSDLWMLLFALVLFIVFAVAPDLGHWIVRAIFIAVALLMFRAILLIRQGPRIERPALPLPGPLLFVLGTLILGMWIWKLVLGFRAGHWIDASIMSMIVAEAGYFLFLVAFR